jgi:hypothetical protein
LRSSETSGVGSAVAVVVAVAVPASASVSAGASEPDPLRQPAATVSLAAERDAFRDCFISTATYAQFNRNDAVGHSSGHSN